MRTFCVILFTFFSIISCSEDDPINEFIENKEEKEVINLGPTDFTIEITNVSDDEATIHWSKAEDPENDPVSYSIYLNQTLLIEGISELTYRFNNLSELTSYSGKVVAKDTNKNEAEALFSFETKKYYLKYLKRYDYGPYDFGTTKYAGGNPYCMIKTNDQNYVIAGKSAKPDGDAYQFFVLKTDYEGNEIWKKFYNYQLYDSWNFKIIESSTGLILVGHHHVLSLDSDGNIIWYKKIDSYDIELANSEIKSVAQNSDGTVYLVGSRASLDDDAIEEAVLTKLDNLGNIIWEKTFKNRPRNFFDDIVISSSNELIVVGSTVEPESEDVFGYWILKLNNSGDVLWENSFGFGYHSIPNQIIIKSNGNYVFAGYKNIFEVNSNGSEIINYPNELPIPFSIAETLDNGFIVTGFDDFGSFGGLGILKLNSSGNKEWSRIYQEPFTYLYGRAVLPESDGGYRIAVRRSKNYYYDSDRPELLIFKTDPFGNYE
ncbi:hypothetical protein GCM10028791_33620 [Echinicola sediminis]